LSTFGAEHAVENRIAQLTFDAWRELREVMATPEKGAWFSAHLLNPIGTQGGRAVTWGRLGDQPQSIFIPNDGMRIRVPRTAVR
jgi:hypothetical protein